MDVYVGNLAYSVTEGQLRALFEDFGAVTNVNLVKDKYSGESKGFGFVTMEKQQEAEAAIKTLNGRALGGRNLNVSLARPKTAKAPFRSRGR